MKERVKELAEQAMNYATDRLIQTHRAGPDFVNDFREKFAELIVRECANVAAEHDALDIYEEIREHFGVAE